MAIFTGTRRDDDLVATGAPDQFRFGENEGVDLIVGFDPSADRLVYTDRSVDGFNDLKVGTLAINGVDSTIIESNDQFTVLLGIEPFELDPADFTFTTGRNDGADFADTFSDLDDLDDDVSLAAIEQRVARLTDVDDPRTEIAPGVFVEPQTIIDGQGDTEVAVFFTNAAGERLAGFFVAEDSELNGSPVVAALGGEGRFAIAWEFADDDDPEDGRVLVRVYDFADGVLTQVGTTKRIGGDDDRTDDPAIATLDDGTFVVVAENDADGVVVAQVFSAEGDLVGEEITVGATNRSGEPAVRVVEDGFVVTFADAAGNTATAGFDNDGTPLGSAPDAEPEPDPQPDPAPGPQPDPDPQPAERPVLTDAIIGTAGRDRIEGTDANELLFGADGNDNLFGGAGDDLLVSGSGNDRLTGGAGSDAFAVTQGSGRTVVEDFVQGEDLLLFLATGTSEFEDLTIRANQRGDAVVRFGDERLVIRDFDADALTAADFGFDLGDWTV